MTTVEELWREADEWSRAADRLQHAVTQRRTSVLALTLLGSAFSATAVVLPTDGAQHMLLFLSAFSVAAAGVVRGTMGLRPAHRWTLARATSEALRSLVFLGLAGAAEDLEADAKRIRRSANPIAVELLSARPVEPPALPAVSDIPTFMAARVLDQLNGYYRPKIATLLAKLKRSRTVELGLLIGGALVAAVAAAWQDIDAAVWVPVLTTAGATVATHTASAHYESQLNEFIGTANELTPMLSPATTDLRSYAQEVEAVLAREHQTWMTKLDEP